MTQADKLAGPQYLTIQQVADHFGLSYGTIAKQVTEGSIPHKQIGKKRLVPKWYLTEQEDKLRREFINAPQ